MIRRIREFLRSESLGIAIPVGVVALWAVWELIQSIVGNFVYPVFLEAFGDESFGSEGFGFPLDFEIGGVRFQWDATLITGVSVLILLPLLYYTFIRPIPGEFEDDDSGTRECPECLSEVLIEARRCAFCTAVIPARGDGPSE